MAPTPPPVRPKSNVVLRLTRLLYRTLKRERINPTRQPQHANKEEKNWIIQNCLSLALVVITAVIATFTIGAFYETRRQAAAAEKSVARAYIYVEVTDQSSEALIPRSANDVTDFSYSVDGFSLRNYGQTPATIISVSITLYVPVSLAAGGLPLDDTFKTRPNWSETINENPTFDLQGAIIAPGAAKAPKYNKEQIFNIHREKPPYWDRIGAASNKYLWFRVLYLDQDDQRRETAYLGMIGDSKTDPVFDPKFTYLH